MKLKFLGIAAAFMISSASVAADKATETVVLITIDGLRWQELFTGVDRAFFDQKDYIAYKKTHGDFKKKYWRKTGDERRRVMMPFFWDTVGKEGQLYGNRAKGSIGNITNQFHFSYPGYSEILTGFADDARITSNDKIPNPNRTILEWLNGKPAHKGKVAAFGSWDVFPYIVNESRSGVPVNAGFEAYDESVSPRVKELNKLQEQIPSPWDTVRLDAFTMGFAREAMAKEKLDLVYIAMGETDDFAHDGHYDLYVDAAHRTDQMISDLWVWFQSDKRYSGKTTMIITTDHGRGSESLEAWKSHGRFKYRKEDGAEAISSYKGDTEIWMAVIGPDTPAVGEVSGGPVVTLSQIAATTARFLGYDYKGDHAGKKAGAPIKEMMK
ncbi:alkaline phosphatase family protein [Kordiimonas laminariae]|uniref:alkaline phosphatase family protein n=1 Tax=Kordiimonas laminariae TaxID=2917717 RepID=UPI001FF55216|nr:alkaline phosphatase family protein [Kordiimonas laminariae]MCK0068279.1 alkaline phosphatase family protein [Kordiimonas laminariae]